MGTKVPSSAYGVAPGMLADLCVLVPQDAARSKQQATAAKNSRTGPPAKKRT